MQCTSVGAGGHQATSETATAAINEAGACIQGWSPIPSHDGRGWWRTLLYDACLSSRTILAIWHARSADAWEWEVVLTTTDQQMSGGRAPSVRRALEQANEYLVLSGLPRERLDAVLCGDGHERDLDTLPTLVRSL